MSGRSRSGLAVALGTAALLVAIAVGLERCGFSIIEHGGPAQAIDGDSLRLANAELRLKGIDAPEYRQQCRDANGRDYECGRQARRALSALLGTGDIACSQSGTDRYGRGLAFCKRAGDGLDIAADMVRQGWALSYGDYASEEQAAMLARRGLWAGSFERPSEWRKRHPREAPVNAPQR